MLKDQKTHSHRGHGARTGTGLPAGKRITLLVLFFLLVGILVAVVLVRHRTSDKGAIAAGDRAPEFQLARPDGKIVSLSDYRGKVVMVHFWATWCPPCVEEIPTLQTLHQRFAGKDFAILGLSVDEGWVAVSAFAVRNGITFPLLLDAAGAVSGSYGTYKFPETYLVDRSGVVRSKVIGPRDWTIPVNQRIIQDLIEGR